MQYFVSKNHNKLNGGLFEPERYVNRVCLNPLYPARVTRPRTRILLDSGAFQDRKTHHRLTFSEALQRQLNFEDFQDFRAGLVVSYDRLVDESTSATGRNKKRVAHQTGKRYVKETIDAAKYLADSRDTLGRRRLVLSCQGVSVPQYVGCATEILEFSEPTDVLGYGGFCIIGQRKSLQSQFFEVLEKTLPKVRKAGLSRVHFFGVGLVPALVRANVMCRVAGVIPSFDTSSYEFNGVMGRVFDPGLQQMVNDLPYDPARNGVRETFPKSDKRVLYDPTELALLNIRLVENFWKEINALPLPKKTKVLKPLSGRGSTLLN